MKTRKRWSLYSGRPGSSGDTQEERSPKGLVPPPLKSGSLPESGHPGAEGRACAKAISDGLSCPRMCVFGLSFNGIVGF